MAGHTAFTVTYNSMNTCWDCTLISVLVFGKYLVAASLLRTNSISSKAADVQAGSIVSLSNSYKNIQQDSYSKHQSSGLEDTERDVRYPGLV